MCEEKKIVRARRGKMILICLVGFLLGGVTAMAVTWNLIGLEGRTLLQAHKLVQNRFVEEYDTQKTLDATLEAMVSSLGDRWSYYLNPEQAQQVREQRDNAYTGIGITVDSETMDGLAILAVTPDSPAQEEGLKAGEIVRSVDGITITKETREAAVNAIKGEEGTTVSLEIEGTDGTRRTVELTRREVHGITASWTMLEGQVGLVTIQNFYSGTADLVKRGVEELQSQGAQGLVFDVRNNPGGYVTELTEILDFLLPEGDIFVSRDWNGKEMVYSSDASCIALPMAVLVNRESYSAAEFLAAQLQETAHAAVIGEKTSGKGYSQLLFSLPNGSAVGLSTARYYTGGRVSLIGTGLHPDVTASLSQENQKKLFAGMLPPEEDEPLQAALQVLKDQE